MYLSLGWKESQHRPQFPGAASHTLLLEMHENDRAQGEERGGAQGELGGLRHDVGAGGSCTTRACDCGEALGRATMLPPSSACPWIVCCPVKISPGVSAGRPVAACAWGA